MHILNKNYNKEYVQIYIWRTLSLVSSFASLLIVIPHISDNKELFGIYSFCISLSLYLSYADIGFLGSGQKYAAEEYAKGNRTAEIKILGFTAFILIVMVIPFTIAMIFLSFNPHLIIDELSSEGVMIASKLFLILGIITPIEILLTRVMQSILIIRIKDYISLRIQIIFNLISILSVLYFFAGDKYQIVEYFLFKSVMALIGSIVIICLIKKIESYDYTKLLKSIKFNKAFYQKSKKLAGSSALLTVSWVIFYELDIVIIGKIFGAEEVAIYAIAFTFLNFLRNIWNIIYSPYSQRFNHLSVESTSNKLKKLASQIIDYTFPLCIITTITLIISSDYFIKLWVGQTYSSSIILMQILIISSFMVLLTNQPNITLQQKQNTLI
ncbi:MAG: polysaccharide biosynthesis protein [Candidatus Paceibacterota bacterium]